eukprot:2364458-Rhodomonas_salina.1
MAVPVSVCMRIGITMLMCLALPLLPSLHFFLFLTLSSFRSPSLHPSIQWDKPVLIWVTNRFDWSNQDHEFTLAHEDFRQHGYFPDEGALSIRNFVRCQAAILLHENVEKEFVSADGNCAKATVLDDEHKMILRADAGGYQSSQRPRAPLQQ